MERVDVEGSGRNDRPVAAPVERLSIADYASGLRSGDYQAEATIRRMLDRVAAANPTVDAYMFVDGARAIATARAVDADIAAGVDLGPLMGVPVAVKDLYAVAGMPMTAGSRVDVSDLAPAEGSIVRLLRRGGAVIVGKTRTTEFAFGTFNPSHPTPRNPADAVVHRMPGGSSAGSAVAQAAGLCAVAFGTDTGGSVRQPAALCGVAGFKTTAGRLAMDGVFPLSPTFDSPGWFCNRAADLAIVWETLSGETRAPAPSIDRLVLGRPDAHFFDQLESGVEDAIDVTIRRLREAGARIVDVTMPSLSDLDAAFGAFLSAELVAHLGRDRVSQNMARLDPVVAERIAPGLTLTADAYITMRRRFEAVVRAAHAAIEGVDAVITPTSPRVAAPVDLYRSTADAAAWSRQTLRFTRPGNLFGFCGVSLPVDHPGSPLPVGLQLLARGGGDNALLALAGAVEAALENARR